MKKDEYTVRTSPLEAVIVTLVSIFVFAAIVFMLLLPYTGEHMQKSMSGDSEEIHETVSEDPSVDGKDAKEL